MKTVKEVSRLTGVSVRTLHHYDAIGLLKPAKVTEAGYRLYDDAALGRLQTILLFRELQFPLKEIREMLDAADFDPIAAWTTRSGCFSCAGSIWTGSSNTPVPFRKQE